MGMAAFARPSNLVVSDLEVYLIPEQPRGKTASLKATQARQQHCNPSARSKRVPDRRWAQLVAPLPEYNAHISDRMTDLGVTAPIVLPLRLPSVQDANVTLSTSCLLFLLYGLLHFTGCALPKQQLSKQERGEWNVRAVSTVNALIISFGGVVSVANTWTLTPRQCFDDFGPVPLFFCQIFLGYLLFDLLLELCAGAPVLRNPSAVIHHLIFVFLNSYVLAYQILPFTFAVSLLGEISTPCLNIRWWLAVTKREKSTAYLLNGAVLAVLFFTFRIVVYGLGLAHLWGLRKFYLAPGQPLLHIAVPIVVLLGYFLNIYWMGLILKGILRAFGRKSKLK